MGPTKVGGPARNTSALALLIAGLLGSGCGTPSSEGDRGPIVPQDRTVPSTPASLPATGMAWVIFGADTVHAEVARTSGERSRGLMNRQELPAGTGMLFVFDDQQIRSFWMQDTFIDLDIAFLDEGLRIVDIQQMMALSQEFHESRAPAMFALEVPQGWFDGRGVRVGDWAEVVFSAR